MEKECRNNLQSIEISDSTKKILEVRATMSDVYDAVYQILTERYGESGGNEIKETFEKKFYELDNVFREIQSNMIDERLSETMYKEM